MGRFSLYHRLLPALLPPTSKIACRSGSKIYLVYRDRYNFELGSIDKLTLVSHEHFIRAADSIE
jgi:hypothetical protein